MVEVVLGTGNWSGVQVYDNGVDISEHCHDIILSPGREATVCRYKPDKEGHHYVEGDGIAQDTPLCIGKISGSWTRRKVQFKTVLDRLYRKDTGLGAETPWLLVL